MNHPSPVLKDATLYLGDNGRCLCGEHSGASARYTGRDISGQRVAAITPEIARMALLADASTRFICEQPNCNRQASLIHTA